MYTKIVGGRILIIGDLHFSDVYTGRHKNYLANCFSVLGDIRDTVATLKPSVVVFLGDIVGQNEGNVKNREVLSQLCQFFTDLKKTSRVFCVRGNHDFNGSFPEFQFLSNLGFFETASTCDGFFDYYGEESQEIPEVRFHLVDYGAESKPLNLKEGGTSNIILAHNNFIIQGMTNWYSAKGGIELAGMSNFCGADMVISGHIHNPSPQIVQTEMTGGGSLMLFYPGCPTRPTLDSGIYESCWYVEFAYDKDRKETTYGAIPFKLASVEDTFYNSDDFVEERTEEELYDMERKQALHEVLSNMMNSRMSSIDLISQVYAVPTASDEAKKLAASYLQVALDSQSHGVDSN